jgi:hypothetical protein
VKIPPKTTVKKSRPGTAVSDADDYYQKGLQHQKIAMDNRPSVLSNREFKKAEILFRKALKIYYKEWKKTKSRAIEIKMQRTQEQIYSTIKYPTLK